MHYPIHFCATKKAFKEAIKGGRDIYLADPSLYSPEGGYLSDLRPAEYYVVGPSAESRKWYAQVIITEVEGKRTIKVN